MRRSGFVLGALRVTLQVGLAAGADPEVLHMGFAVLTRDTLADGATLEIELAAMRAYCPTCACEFEPAQVETVCNECPRCHCFTSVVIQGKGIAFGRLEVTGPVPQAGG